MEVIIQSRSLFYSKHFCYVTSFSHNYITELLMVNKKIPPKKVNLQNFTFIFTNIGKKEKKNWKNPNRL
jgi:hypothetical protein